MRFNGTGQEPRQLSHIAEDQRPWSLQVFSRGQSSREAKREHSRGARRLDAVTAVLDDRARGRIRAHPCGGVKEEVGRGFSPRNLAGAEDASAKRSYRPVSPSV